jgi:uncharacterized protein (DUF1778 family)
MPVVLKRERLTIDLPASEHRKIKAYAAYKGESLREFVLESIKTRMERDAEEGDFLSIMTKTTTLLEDLWNNKKDAAYDRL